jgi:hypothetical protein
MGTVKCCISIHEETMTSASDIHNDDTTCCVPCPFFYSVIDVTIIDINIIIVGHQKTIRTTQTNRNVLCYRAASFRLDEDLIGISHRHSNSIVSIDGNSSRS